MSPIWNKVTSANNVTEVSPEDYDVKSFISKLEASARMDREHIQQVTRSNQTYMELAKTLSAQLTTPSPSTTRKYGKMMANYTALMEKSMAGEAGGTVKEKKKEKEKPKPSKRRHKYKNCRKIIVHQDKELFLLEENVSKRPSWLKQPEAE